MINQLVGKRVRAKSNCGFGAVIEGEVLAVDFASKAGWMLLIQHGALLSQCTLGYYDVEVL